MPDFVTKALGAEADVIAPDGCEVRIVYTSAAASAEISLGREWRLPPSDETLARLRERFGSDKVSLRYAT